MKLIDGRAGGPGRGACWMGAIWGYTEEPLHLEGCPAHPEHPKPGACKCSMYFGDSPKCVHPVIAHMCIDFNDDHCTDDDREALIGPHLFAPAGTAELDSGTLYAIKRKHLDHLRGNTNHANAFKAALLACILECCALATPKEKAAVNARVNREALEELIGGKA